MEKFLKNTIWVCLAIIPFVALYISNGTGIDILNSGTAGMFFPFISGKNLLFRALVEIAFASWIIVAIKDAKYRPKKSVLLIAYAVFMTVILFADIFGVNRTQSIWSNFERMEGFVGHIHFFLYFVVLTSFLNSQVEWLKMMRIAIFSNLLVVGYGFLQFLGGQLFIFAKIAPGMSAKFRELFPIHMSAGRIDSTIGNSAYFGVYCLLFAFLSALLFTQSKEKGQRRFYAIIVIVNLLGVFYSGTRGSMVGVLGGVLVTLFIESLKEKGKIRNTLFAALIGVVVLVGGVFLFKNSSFIKNSPSLDRFASISISDVTTMSRVTIWEVSFNAWKERPLLGYGQDNFTYIFARKFDPAKMYNLEPWYDRSHDVFFDWLVAGGVLGLVSYLSLFFFAFYLMWKHGSEMPLRERAIITGALVGYFIHNIFVFDNLTSYILFFMILAYIAVRTNKEGNYGEHWKIASWDQLVQPFVAVILVVSLYYINYLPFLGNRTLIRAMDISAAVQSQPFNEVIKTSKDNFEEAMSYSPLGREEAMEQMLLMAGQLQGVKIPDTIPDTYKNAIKTELDNYSEACRETINKSMPTHSTNVRALAIFGIFYNSIGDSQSAKDVLTKALVLAPKKQLILFDMVRAQVGTGDYEGAYQTAKSTYLLQPKYDEAKKMFILTGIYSKHYEDAKETIAQTGQEFPDGDTSIIGALISSGQIKEGIDLLNGYKQKHPESAAQIDEYIKNMLVSQAQR